MPIDARLGDRIGQSSIEALSVGVSEGGTRSDAHSRHAPGDQAALSASSPYRIASLTKSFTSVATVLALTERGIPLSTPALELLPALAPDWNADRSITVEQLLAQVAGLRESVDSETVAALGDGPDALSETARLVVRDGSERPPGEKWSYYNGNYFLAGALLSALTGERYEDALERILLRPWSLARTRFATPASPIKGRDGAAALPLDPYPRGRRPSGGLWSCVADLLTFAEHVLRDGTLLEEIRRPRTNESDPVSYGLGWALGPSGQMYLNGRLAGYRAAMLLVPEQRYASAVLANQTQALPEVARILSDLQAPLTGDDLMTDIDRFAA